MKALLKKHFGYDTFRPLQEEIIQNVLAGSDNLVIMPTGGGKSLCYQLPALQLAGLTVVISPLISLMKDQVDALRANGIPAAFINSTLPTKEILEIQKLVTDNHIKILYLAPERLTVEKFRKFFDKLNIALIAIDEAHCISEWGHDFRPDYRNLKSLHLDFPQVPIIALTATATKQVREDIANQLSLQSPKTFIASFDRPNLKYTVIPKRNSFQNLLAVLSKYPRESVIIYCFSRQNTEDLAQNLRQESFNALPYHAGLNAKTRKETQELFIHDKIQIIAATIAFGMGIDKPNIRLVVHYDLPKSIEGYYQETGRAGRDGLLSDCVLFYTYADARKHRYFIDQIENPEQRQAALRKLEDVLAFGRLAGCRREYLLGYFGESYDSANCKNCDNCLTPPEEFDATEISKNILSAVLRCNERFGINYVMNILLGESDEKILANQHQKLSVFGVARDFDKRKLRDVIQALIQREYLRRTSTEYPVLELTAKAKIALKEKQTIFLPKFNHLRRKGLAADARGLDFDASLFEQLRTLRKRIALTQGVPPYIVFGDVTLKQMAKTCPQIPQDLLAIPGVGEEKLQKYGPAFLLAIKQYLREKHEK